MNEPDWNRPPYRYQIDPPGNSAWWVGLAACILVAIAAQSHALPEPWNHVFSIGGAVGAAINGYLIRRP
jgi:hypothetical protein